MSAQVRLLEELIQKYKGSTAAVDNALAEFESQAGRKATKEEFDQALGKAPAASTETGSALSPQDIEARAASRGQQALPPGSPQRALPPGSQPPAVRSITDMVPGRDPFAAKPQVLGEVRPRELAPGRPEAPAPLRQLQAGQAPAAKEPVQLTEQGTLPPEGLAAIKERIKPGESKAGVKALAGGALLGAATGASMLAGKKPEQQAKTAQASPQAVAAGKKELKQVVTESKEEYPMSQALKLSAPEDVGAALRAAEKATPDSSLPKDARADFAAKRGQLEQRMKDAEKMYIEALSAGQEDRQRRDMMVAVASVVERLGLALTSYFAAKQGMAMGAPVASNLKIQPSDANAAFDRSLKEYDQLAEEQKGLFSFRTRGVEREQDLLGRQEEKFAEGEQRTAERASDRAFAESKLAEDKRQFEEGQKFRREEGTAERASREKIAGMGSESRIEAANIRAAAQAARGSLNAAREEAKKSAAAADAYKRLEGAMAILKGKPSDKTALRTFTESATVLGIPPEEQDSIVTAASGQGLLTLQDVEKARGMTSKYAPGQAAQASAGPAGVVRLRNPETGKVHEMTEAEAAEARKYGYTDVR